MNKHDLKRKISKAATKRYITNRYFSIASLAETLGIKESEILEQFKTRTSILQYYYESRVHLCKEQSRFIDGYESFSLSEKLSNLFLTMIDLFSEEKEFVRKTYSALIVKRECGNNGFKKQMTNELKELFLGDETISTAGRPFVNRYLFHAVYLQFHGLMWFWLSDDSPNHENTLALIDKWSTLIEEIFYSKITDKSFDLLKFLAYNSPLKNFSPQKFKTMSCTQ
ncbi:MAG: hypothetical protein JJU37_08075 [Balneolaceae bacterium]|nr:hypothetical protein [Balneolaceae bacterium]